MVIIGIIIVGLLAFVTLAAVVVGGRDEGDA
jgi:hypothetical protein